MRDSKDRQIGAGRKMKNTVHCSNSNHPILFKVAHISNTVYYKMYKIIKLTTVLTSTSRPRLHVGHLPVDEAIILLGTTILLPECKNRTGP